LQNQYEIGPHPSEGDFFSFSNDEKVEAPPYFHFSSIFVCFFFLFDTLKLLHPNDRVSARLYSWQDYTIKLENAIIGKCNRVWDSLKWVGGIL
jgi:hypothetical protein